MLYTHLLLVSEYENVREDPAFCYGVLIGSTYVTFIPIRPPKAYQKYKSVVMCGVRDADRICYEVIFIKGVVHSV